MSFIQREIDKINEALRNTPNDHANSEPLRLAQQALVWALDPDTVSSPSAYLSKFFNVEIDTTNGTGVSLEGIGAAPASTN